MKNITPETISHIMVWMPNWIGDAIFALPSIERLREHFKNSRITAIAPEPVRQLLETHLSLDGVLVPPSGYKKNILEHCLFAKRLRKYKIDLLILFPNSLRVASLAFLSGARFRLGYQTEGRRFFLTHPVALEATSRKLHGRDYYYNLIRRIGFENTSPPELDSIVSRKEKRAASRILQHFGISSKDFLVAIQPGASKPEKRWHVERFGILCQRLIKEKNAKILILGSRKEKKLGEKIRNYCPEDKVFVLMGIHLKVVAAMIDNAKLYIGNDSGLTHLAALVKTPLVAIFGPGDPLTTDPMITNEKKEIVSLGFSCSPCRQRFFKDCSPSPHNKPYCIEDISVGEVMQSVDRLLNKL